jgi:hypothetical protein
LPRANRTSTTAISGKASKGSDVGDVCHSGPVSGIDVELASKVTLLVTPRWLRGDRVSDEGRLVGVILLFIRGSSQPLLAKARRFAAVYG